MKLDELLSNLESPIIIRPTRQMTQGELETYFDKAADILRGNADHSEFRGYVLALLFYKRINDCYEEEVRTQADTLVKAGVPHEQALSSPAIRRTTISLCPRPQPGPRSRAPQRVSLAWRRGAAEVGQEACLVSHRGGDCDSRLPRSANSCR